MITRVKIDGFKSLLDTELCLGPFTCIAGDNAIGKSNFFDALVFLSNLADNTLLQTAKSIRSDDQRHSNVKDIFFKSGDRYQDVMRFEIDMIIPHEAEDDLGQTATATITSLRYILELKLNEEAGDKELIEIQQEELVPIMQPVVKESLHFEYSDSWLKSVLKDGRSSKIPFISTKSGKIKLHQDVRGGKKGRTTEFIAQRMPRTLLSTVTAESPTAFLARHEMRNWMMLQFEPSALREPNSTFEVKNAEITANGTNLPATLYRLHNEKKETDVYQQLTNRLKMLVDNIQEISVDKDEKRDLLTLQIRFRDGLVLPAQSLSDGTLRFLGLATIETDSSGSRLICMEEPENGISPKKINEMIELLEDMASDTEMEADEGNPLRQVIINTHSPLVVRKVSDESLYMAREKEKYLEAFGKKVKYTAFSALQDTWKTRNTPVETTTKGELLAYLDNTSVNEPVSEVCEPEANYHPTIPRTPKRKRTVAENITNQVKIDFST